MREKPRTKRWRPAGVDLAGCSGQQIHLYVIRELPAGAFKIGVAGRPEARLATLQQANPRKLELVCSLPVRLEAEKRLHRALAAHRLVGEWFHPSRPVLAAVAELKEMAAYVRDMTRAFELSDMVYDHEDFENALCEHSDDWELFGRTFKKPPKRPVGYTPEDFRFAERHWFCRAPWISAETFEEWIGDRSEYAAPRVPAAA